MGANGFIEPADVTYARRPITFASLDQTVLVDTVGGTVGPAGASWGTIGYIGIFDAPVGGNLLLWLLSSTPLQIKAGGTITAPAGSLNMVFRELGGSMPVRSWPSGAVVAVTQDGRAVTVGVPLQFVGGTISAQVPVFGTTVSMASLPQSQPTSGTGQLWNNGGVISVA